MKLCFICVLPFIYVSVINCGQIPRTILPIKYDLTITPYFETESESYFNGDLVFSFKPLKHNQGKRLALHVDNLEINSYTLLENGKDVSKQQDVISDSANQLVYFDYGRPLSVDNNYELRINYSGSISADGWGLFKGVYEHEKKKRFFTATQLRPVFARRLLPCLDEPVYKARFTLRVWRLPQYTARSNMPRVDTSPKSLTTGRVMDTFAETPLMSTFLLALVVFDFSSLSSPDGKFTSWTVPAKLHLAEYGHTMIPGIVKSMEDIAGCEFPLPKMDQIALPQLNPVAMENWGMNTFREVNMLYKEGMFAPVGRQDVPRFTGHEVAHYWLGNLVTLEWWSWLWISEMYAMYYEYYLPSQLEPSWKMADQIAVRLTMPGLLEDSFSNSIPMTTNVSTNQEVLTKFSGLTYTKGPSLVRMIDAFMEHSLAEKAIKALIQEKKYGTVNPTELWRIYDRHAESLPTNMWTIMSNWTDQPGYPLVTVTTNQSAGTITLQQDRFLLEGVDSDAVLWWIPLTFTGGNRPNFTNTRTRLWLTPKTNHTTVRLGRHIESWVIFNIKLIGFYRVDYDPQNWHRLVDSLLTKPSTIHELNRAQLLDDSFALARAGKQSYHLPLRLATYLRQELCYFPWAAFIPNANFLLNSFNGHPVYDGLREFMRHLVSPVYNHVGFHVKPTDLHLLQVNRVQIVTFACSLGLPACITDANSLEGLNNLGNSTEIPPGLEFTQLCTVLESGLTSTNWTHKLSFWSLEDQIRAMPCAADKTVLTRYLVRSLQEDSASEWRVKLMASITRPANINFVFSLLIEQFKNLLTKFGSLAVADYFTQVGSGLSTRSQLAELAELNAAVNDTDVANAIRTVSLALNSRLNWAEKLTTNLQTWLDDFNMNKRSDAVLSPVQCS